MSILPKLIYKSIFKTLTVYFWHRQADSNVHGWQEGGEKVTVVQIILKKNKKGLTMLPKRVKKNNLTFGKAKLKQNVQSCNQPCCSAGQVGTRQLLAL